MTKKMVTRDLVQKAVSDLEAEKSKPTTRKIREKLGFGSFTTIAKIHNELKEESSRPPACSPDGEEVPPSVAALAKPVFEAADREAEAKYGSRIAELEGKLEDTISKLHAEREAIAAIEKEKENAVLEKEKAAKKEEHANFERNFADRERQTISFSLEDLQKKNGELEAKLREITDRKKQEESDILANLQKENARLQDLLFSAIGKKEQLEAGIHSLRAVEDLFENNNLNHLPQTLLATVEQISQKMGSLEGSKGKKNPPKAVATAKTPKT